VRPRPLANSVLKILETLTHRHCMHGLGNAPCGGDHSAAAWVWFNQRSSQ
jgi:hypothetical protein